jgi:hypothetical protein
MNTGKRIFAGIFSITLALSVMVAGCQSKTLTTEEILANTMTAMEKIDSYKIAYNLVLDMEIVGGKQAMKISMDGTGTGAMDVINKKMQMALDVNAEIPGAGTTQMKMTMTMDMYMVDGWLYTKMTIPTAKEQWTKTKIEGNEISQDQLAQLLLLLKSTTQSTLTGTEKVNGVDCYVLELTPNMTDLWQWMMSQQGNLAEGVDLSQFDISKLIKSYELKYWISKTDFSMVKAKADLNMDVDPAAVGASADDFERMTMLINMDMTFSDYNKAVDIQLPADAVNAQETSQ